MKNNLKAGEWRDAYLCSCDMVHMGKAVPKVCPLCGDRWPFLGEVQVRSIYRRTMLGLVKRHVRWEVSRNAELMREAADFLRAGYGGD